MAKAWNEIDPEYHDQNRIISDLGASMTIDSVRIRQLRRSPDEDIQPITSAYRPRLRSRNEVASALHARRKRLAFSSQTTQDRT